MTSKSRDDNGVSLTVRDGVALIILSRPSKGNALDLATALELRDAMGSAAASPDARAIVLRGQGKRFCVGGDLQAFRAAPEDARLCDEVAQPLHEAIEIMHSARQPIVCLVHGAVGGGANGLVLAADIVIASDDTVFRTGYTGSGLSPDCGVTWEMPRRVGLARAMDLILTNRRIDAAEAADMGIVSRVVPVERLDEALSEVLSALSLVPVETLTETKRLVRGAATSSVSEQLDDEARTIGWIGDTPDTREAISAFLDKRAPTFSR